MSDHFGGCPHLPIRFSGKAWLGELDMTVGPAYEVAVSAIRRLLDGEANGLLLSGPVGCGKSVLAAAACNDEADRLEAELRRARGSGRGPDAPEVAYWLRRQGELAAQASAYQRQRTSCPRWLSVPGTIAALKGEMHSDERPTAELVKAAIKTRGIVVLDDLGTEKASDWTVETLSAIVCDRYDAARRTVVTSNLSAARLVDLGYDRIVSRLADGGMLLELASLSDYRMKLRQTVA